MRIAFIGCVEFSAALLEVLLDHPDAELVGLVTRTDSTINADFRDLRPLAQQAACPVFTGNDITEMTIWLREHRPDVIFCFGWSHLLPAEILAIPPLGVMGYHPAALPQNRGRHPIIWALALGLKDTASTFFLMNESADSGDILSQQTVNIAPNDNAGDLYHKLMNIARSQLTILISALAANTIQRTPQNHSATNYWRKRSTADGRIDWRMSAHTIHNLIRALARPYPGAQCEHNGHTVTLWRACPVHTDSVNLEPGKVLSVDGNFITVKCGEAAIKLLEHDFRTLPQEGHYL
ncbi:MAG: formyl transferase [Gammaproteobacteria bacterium]|nr:formyl transferase [Gammaproteobacteria bacterium]